LFNDNEDRTNDMCVLSKLKDNGIIGIGTLILLASELTVLVEDLECNVASAEWGVEEVVSSWQ